MKYSCCLVLAFVLFAQSVDADELTVIHAGWLLAVPGEPPAPRQSIVIRNGRIAGVSSGYLRLSDLGETETTGSSARIVDLSQAFVLPGLIDSHVHLSSAPGHGEVGRAVLQTEAELALVASKHAEMTLQAGFTTVVDFGSVGTPGNENAIFAVRDAVRDGRLAGPRVLAAGTPIAATGLERSSPYRDEVIASIDNRSVCDSPYDCRRAVRHQVKRGSDIIVFFNTGSLLAENPVAQTMTEEEMRAIVQTAHSLGRKVIADGHHAAGIAAADSAGADIVDSLHLYDDTTFGSLRNDIFVQSHIYGIVQAVGDTPESLHTGLWGWLPEPILLRFQAIRLRPFAVMQAYREGIRNIAYASDAGVYAWGENAGDFVEFVKRGMSSTDALKSATVNAARMLGLDNELGSIAAGMKADIIAVQSSPLDDISELSRILFVMRDGIIYRQPL
jgi:imidazolonepropionase-like amidohydrolase